jgi:glycolate oxidase iron-sulfur subunit
MNHAIPSDALGPAGQPMAHAIEACVHCGFCLPTCPTYRVLGEEMDSPRGRIVLMKTALEGGVAVADTLPFVDRCLGCLACVTACPSGVRYDELLMLYRERAVPHRRDTLVTRASRVLLHQTLPHANRARLAFAIGRLAKPLAARLPSRLAAMLSLVPARLPKPEPLPQLVAAIGRRRARVALLAGCVQSALAPEIASATIRVLARNGVEVVVPPGQGCCGALALHAGDLPRARELARPLLDVFPADVDAVICNAAGCGSAMKEYGLLFSHDADEARARALASKTRDVTEFLADLGLLPPPALGVPLVVAYHDACHLVNAQRIAEAPRELLRQVGNLTLVVVEEGELCCGSAGTYNVDQPAIASALGERKARHLLASGARAVVAGNIGCLVQIRMHLERLGQPLPVWHTIEVLDRAYQGH